MSRSGYTEDGDGLNLYRANVRRALNGKRGQAALRELLAALESMKIRELGAGTFQRGESPCTLGVLAGGRGLDVSDLEPTEYGPGEYAEVDMGIAADRFNLATCMVAEIMYENDEGAWIHETDEERWHRMRRWVRRQILGEALA